MGLEAFAFYFLFPICRSLGMEVVLSIGEKGRNLRLCTHWNRFFSFFLFFLFFPPKKPTHFLPKVVPTHTHHTTHVRYSWSYPGHFGRELRVLSYDWVDGPRTGEAVHGLAGRDWAFG